MLKSALAAATLALCASAASAATVTVDFDVYFLESSTAILAGSFTGTDTNNDGVLSLSELTSFNATELQDVGVPDPVTLADLDGFGGYTIATNTWSANGSSWSGYDDVAYFTWNDSTYSANSYNTWVSTSVSSVPEPASLAMMGLGALALLARRQRRAA